MDQSKPLRKRVYQLLEVADKGDWASRSVDLFLLSLIVLNVLALNLESISPWGDIYRKEFLWFERISVIIFTAEYLLRIWSSAEHPGFSGGLGGRVRFASKPLLLLDLLTILPFYLNLVGIDLRFLRSARLFRSFRLLRLARYLRSMQIFARVFKRHREDLVTTMFFMMLLLLFSGSLMYFVERHAQPEKFASIPASMWWAVATLTTVGYGDAYPITALGKIIASFIAILGIGMVALPAGILSSGFNEELRKKEEARRRRCPHCSKHF